MRTLALALASILLLAACSGGSDPAGQAKPSATTTTAAKTATVKPTVSAPRGKPAPEALSSFRCGADKKGQWSASGYLSNGGASKVTYWVTVYVGPAAGGQEDARTTQVASVAPGGSVQFSIDKVPAPKDGGPCHVQVLAGA